MTKAQMAQKIDEIFAEIQGTREAGQKEYASGTDNAFANFEKLAAELGIPREKVLWVYAMKHKDGIASALNGHVSQREPVQGRIKDLIVYLCLLWGMIDEAEAEPQAQTLGWTTSMKTPQDAEELRIWNKLADDLDNQHAVWCDCDDCGPR